MIGVTAPVASVFVRAAFVVLPVMVALVVWLFYRRAADATRALAGRVRPGDCPLDGGHRMTPLRFTVRSFRWVYDFEG